VSALKPNELEMKIRNQLDMNEMKAKEDYLPIRPRGVAKPEMLLDGNIIQQIDKTSEKKSRTQETPHSDSHEYTVKFIFKVEDAD
jgi:hypothetical protein